MLHRSIDLLWKLPHDPALGRIELAVENHLAFTKKPNTTSSMRTSAVRKPRTLKVACSGCYQPRHFPRLGCNSTNIVIHGQGTSITSSASGKHEWYYI